MPFDLILRDVRLDDGAPVDIGILDGRIAATGPSLEGAGPEERLAGRLAVPGFVAAHIHLDKSCLLGRCRCDEGTLAEAVAEIAKPLFGLKAGVRTFTRPAPTLHDPR